MKLLLLRGLLMVDAAVLFLLGGWLILAPSQIERAFHFQDLPPAVAYLIGLWGCVFATMGWGYVVAATNPLRHRVWIQVGIGRGALECLLGIIYLVRGTVTFRQAGLGVLVAALISVAYIALYPRKPRLVPGTATAPATQPSPPT
jgi:hypothetical protein